MQLVDVTRRRVNIEEWGKVRIGFLKDIPISRRNLLCYVANELGGAHYNSKRLPSDPQDKEPFRLLASAYDWENEAIMHTGLIAVGLSYVEILSAPDVLPLLKALHEFHDKRQQRLMRGEAVPQPSA